MNTLVERYVDDLFDLIVDNKKNITFCSTCSKTRRELVFLTQKKQVIIH